jgi:hypothetical protein
MQVRAAVANTRPVRQMLVQLLDGKRVFSCCAVIAALQPQQTPGPPPCQVALTCRLALPPCAGMSGRSDQAQQVLLQRALSALQGLPDLEIALIGRQGLMTRCTRVL